ncbi:uncharacterized protein A4U43_C01F33300 [Asparagus officinalis]|uniref:Uncharacterized protein n=1 Tax=Asparagus officinalis TaxID=4686 RepID=A0A5P1FXE9_ASPOF|nr:protein cornichon homolog 1-like isoform X2 [Asparagus officinalis]ONK81830.1 uncharacterized protein A4U43_C01F33300 [Asparagus officinalis]
MAWELLFWLYAFASVIGLVALTAYQLICLSDLEYDYINPYDSSARINAVVIPEFVVQGALCTLLFLTWHWFPFLLMAPVTYYHIRLFMERKHHIDVTEIFRVLNVEKKYRMVKLALYFIIFFIVIYSLVVSAIVLLLDEHEMESVTF